MCYLYPNVCIFSQCFPVLGCKKWKMSFSFFLSRGKNFQNTFWWFEVLSSGHAKFTLRTTHYTLHWKCREGLGNLLFTSSMWISKLSDLEYLYKPTLVVLIIWTEWCEKWLIWMMEFTVIEENMFQQQKTTEDIRTLYGSSWLNLFVKFWERNLFTLKHLAAEIVVKGQPLKRLIFKNQLVCLETFSSNQSFISVGFP